MSETKSFTSPPLDSTDTSFEIPSFDLSGFHFPLNKLNVFIASLTLDKKFWVAPNSVASVNNVKAVNPSNIKEGVIVELKGGTSPGNGTLNGYLATKTSRLSLLLIYL